jgi:hypothetical protein
LAQNWVTQWESKTMIICITPDEFKGLCPPYERSRALGHACQLFGDRSHAWDGPCGHSVTQGPQDVTKPHFHEADQYQIVIDGSGHVGGHHVSVGSVHYADGYAGYGPIISEEAGLTYLTLRSSFDTTHHRLPYEAERARGRRGRQHMAKIDFELRDPGLVTLTSREDGMSVRQQRLAPNEALADFRTPGARYFLVMDGEVAIDGRSCSEHTCLWVGESETPPPIVGGQRGALVAMLCFPSADSRIQRQRLAWETALA